MTITIDGVTKTVGPQTTGEALHALAGNPAKLQSGGQAIAKNSDAVTVTDHQAFSTK